MSHKMFNYKKSTMALALLAAFHGQAAEKQWTAYEIVNIDDMYSVANSQLPLTRNGYGGDINNQEAVIGIAQGRNNTNTSDDDDNSGLIGEVDDAIFPEVTALTPNVTRPFQGNNFGFELEESDAWKAIHNAIAGQVAPNDEDASATKDVFYFGLHADKDIRVGRVSGTQTKVADPTPSEDDDDPNFYYRDFEARGFVKAGSNDEFLLAPSDDTAFYTSEVEGATQVEVGGFSVASAIATSSDNGSEQVVGYVSTELSKNSKDNIDSCWNSFNDAETPDPIEVCIQNLQNGSSINYQLRPAVWTVDTTSSTATLDKTLALPFTPDDDDSNIYSALGLGINSQGVVIGESNQRNNDNNLMSYTWAQVWMPDGTIISPTDLDFDGLRGSTATAINDNGIAVGSVARYIGGYQRTKFWTYDVNSGEKYFTEPRDFNAGNETDLASIAKDINDAGLVVGNIEVDVQKQLPRRRNAFVYDYSADKAGDTGAFTNLNELLTCESRGYQQDDNGGFDSNGQKWSKFKITDNDTFAQPITYEADFVVVEANSINDNGEIVGTALVELPRVLVDSSGKVVTEEVTDPNTGETVTKVVIETDATGKPITDQLPRPVVLRPSSDGQSCQIPLDNDTSTQEPNERSGASLPLWLMALLPVAWLRRRRK